MSVDLQPAQADPAVGPSTTGAAAAAAEGEAPATTAMAPAVPATAAGEANGAAQQTGPQPMDADGQQGAEQHTVQDDPSDVLGMNVQAFLDDMALAVAEYCAEEFDEMERFVVENFILTEEQRASVSQGIQRLYEASHQRLEARMGEFDAYAWRGPLHVPAGLVADAMAAPAAAAAANKAGDGGDEAGAVADEQQEAAAVAKLQGLRQQVAQQYERNQQLRKRIADADAAVRNYSELPADVRAVVDAASSALGKENNAASSAVADDLGAVTVLSKRLAPQLARAAEVLASNPVLAGNGGARTAALNADKELARRQAATRRAPLEALAALQQQLGC